jgi:diacylglycerol kinase (ATP)
MDEARIAIEKAIHLRQVNGHIIVPIMGGDGSTAGIIGQLMNDSFLISSNLSLIAFAPLPFGTGNDISRATGWGPSEDDGAWSSTIQTLIGAVCCQNYDRLTLWDVEV